MQNLNLPEYEFNIRESGNSFQIYDPFRQKFVLLTPEEQVRQHFSRFLIHELEYPESLMMTEHAMVVDKMRKRCDIIAFHRNGTPVLLVECKAPMVSIDKEVFDQVARYNIAFRLKYLMVTNGVKHYCCRVDFAAGSVDFMDHLPRYGEVIAGVEENTRR